MYFERHGGPEVLQYGDLPDPVAAADEIVVDVHAASVNGADWRVREGGYNAIPSFPHVLGRDFSGVVSAIGPQVTDLSPGDAVFGALDNTAGIAEGAYAEKLATRAEIVARKPDGISHVEAAAVALCGLTAVAAIEKSIRLQAGESILIHGGAGGVAGFAIQLAKHLGARVITTASGGNHDYVRQLGADEAIDYNAVDFRTVVTGCDAVFDTVGGDVTEASFAVLRPGGRLASIASFELVTSLDQPRGAAKAIKIAPPSPRGDICSLLPHVRRDRPHLERVAYLVSSGAIAAPEIAVFGLAQAADALRISQGRHLRGKLVLCVR